MLVLSSLNGRHVEHRVMQHEGTVVIPTAGGASIAGLGSELVKSPDRGTVLGPVNLAVG